MKRSSGVRALERPRREWGPALVDRLLSPRLEEALKLLEEVSTGGVGEPGSDSAVRWARSSKSDGVYSVRPAIVQSVCRLNT